MLTIIRVKSISLLFEALSSTFIRPKMIETLRDSVSVKSTACLVCVLAADVLRFVSLLVMFSA